MGLRRVVFKPVASDVDAGTHDERLYDKALHPWRSKIRRWLIPLVRAETPYIAKLQNTIRTPVLDSYFLWTANLGTHTFFMIFLPILVWFDASNMAKSIACMAAVGVFTSGFIKDFMCLPRPLSPPVHRLSMSSSTSLEYGFPSTHSTNSISAALFMISLACESYNPESPLRVVCIIGAFLYATSIVFGRVYCGMHSVTDIVGGGVLAYVLYWFQWTFRDEFNSMFTTDSIVPVVVAILLCLSLVGLHPDPIERCPCFEDSVCFMGVLIGLFPGGWLCNHSEYCTMGQQTLALTQSTLPVAAFVVLSKLVLGVATLFIWRIVCKKACYFILPPIYRAFNLPHRKFEIGARTYKSLNRESIHPIPSVLDLRHLAGTVAEAEHVGIQSSIDLHEKTVYEQQLQHRGGRDEKESATVESPVYDPTTLLVAEDAPLRYDVDIVTKLIVYAGIGFLALCPVPMLFQFSGLSS
ncbi:PAP2 superfamily-domain-containing protein [Fennellomyces sp. T-0311]|nr:PAP2 superfamily-domain-containing protein [Fennellomyces sp. T-0311]